MKKVVYLIFIAVLVLALIVACAQKQDTQPAPNQTPQNGTDEQGNAKEADGPKTAEGIADGEYQGVSSKDERGNYGVVKITVSNGRITEVEYTEFTGDDKMKSKEGGYEYEPALEAFEALARELKDEQDLDEVDTYSGATGTTQKFKEAVMNALAQGKQ